ncbi:Short-chain dehydrogenase/reductase SDR [Corynebacterium glyciniphilum AJ 3170]|uniref:Short-chain dehydrogenase/reductase SDR n=1 Tax=Corynebacterium glyciniphilum AJ 3170 TaxID=1404245 RepID=X5DXZ9_9CORY|nr:SDR family oxidoreductase [Corynebacterium glyciniphilum]AHW65472.1 Short-chain dehydrogenase/reductase SDR [Corynebacterium glyciniphilum AJ 3170]
MTEAHHAGQSAAFTTEGSTVVVTGAGNGIGAALARSLARHGARVVVSDLDEAGAAHTGQDIIDTGGEALVVAGDAASEEGVTSLVERARGTYGEIDAWFANAGVDLGHGLDAAEADWDTSVQVNMMAHVRAAKLLVPGWAERGHGRFVVTASAAGLLTMLGAPAYSATKHGAVAFAEWLSATYRHRGVVVQAICPQGVQTRMLAGTGPYQELLGRDTALTPEQVADTVMEALQGDDFYILPHPEVADYYTMRATTPDRWLKGMNKIARTIESKEQ